MTSRHRTSSEVPGPIDVGQAEAALVEHYPRLVRLAYLVLPPAQGRHRRVLAAHAVVQRALPRGRASSGPGEAPVPAPRDGGGAPAELWGTAGPDGTAYAYVRGRVLRGALAGERPRRFGPLTLPPLPLFTGLFPRVVGLRLIPRSGGADELALDQALSEVSGAARAAFVLRGLEGLPDSGVHRLLRTAGILDPEEALAEADLIASPAGSRDEPLLGSSEFDPCRLHARPTDLMRRRQHGRAALAAAVAVLVCGGLLGLPDGSWGPDGAAAPRYAQNASAQKALSPGAVTRSAASEWETSSRMDFSVWPARGELTGDEALLRRALAVWARPGEQVAVSATRGTSTGPPSAPPRLLYAGELDGADVVLLQEGLRVARYAEPHGAGEGGAALDLARTDVSGLAGSSALVIARNGSNVRYLTAPWVSRAAAVDLMDAEDLGRRLSLNEDGVTEPARGPVTDPRDCSRRPGLLLDVRGGKSPYLYTDLGELTPARLTAGAPRSAPRDATGPAARALVARTVCGMSSMAGNGVRSVNAWQFARQRLPGNGGAAAWVCTRAETWRGTGTHVQASLRAPGKKADAQAVPAARATDSPACGPRDPRVLSGALWKSRAGDWYLLAAGSREVTSVRATGGVRAGARGRTLAVRAQPGDGAELTARLSDGSRLRGLH